jgi:hypothetical protein
VDRNGQDVTLYCDKKFSFVVCPSRNRCAWHQTRRCWLSLRSTKNRKNVSSWWMKVELLKMKK